MSDLDDFFAKKDKKKKSKNKDQPLDKKVKKKEKIIESIKNEDEEKPVTEIDEHPVHDEEQWSDFQEEQETDYSGLKIQKLEIVEPEPGTGGDSQGEEDGEDGSGNQGPWNKIQQMPTEPEPVIETKPEPLQIVPQSGGYIPPHLRGKQEVKPSPRVQPGSRRRNAPDIKNEESFPTLAAAVSEEVTVQKLTWAKQGFEQVKSGGSRSAGQNSEAPKINLENRYDALSS